MKTTASSSNEDTPKASQSKTNKKSTKSRAKSTKSDVASKATSTSCGVTSIPTTPTSISMVTTPTTPTSSTGGYNLFEASFAGAGNSTDTLGNSSKSHHKSYAGLEPRSVKIIWEQHDQSDLELSQEVCARVAEDASYKLWELIHNIKTYSRHSSGIVTYDLVNEVLKQADVPPALGAMDSDWERIDYDGSYFFNSDKILELRDEYRKEIKMGLPEAADFTYTCPVEDKHTEHLKQYIPNLIHVALHGNTKQRDTALTEAAGTPLMGACYRVILAKMLKILALKQNEEFSARVWRLLCACNANPSAHQVHCRQEYFHLAEILISQLLAPFESIKSNVKNEKVEEFQFEKPRPPSRPKFATCTNLHSTRPKITKIKLLDDPDEVNLSKAIQPLSPYFASPVDAAYVDDLCRTIGQLAAQHGYLHGECLYLITRRLERFFEGREVCNERDYIFLSRAVRGLLALGEYAFREFIPYIYKLKVDDIPDSLWQHFAVAAVFLNGSDDIYLYEWLEYGCGADRLQPFMLHYARAHESLLVSRTSERNSNAFVINPKPGVRRLEWSALAAAMCHGDDPGKALKSKINMQDLFPELITPNLQLNRAGTIRFKFAGCRPMLLLKHKQNSGAVSAQSSPATNGCNAVGGIVPACINESHTEILIARRKLLRPISNVRRHLVPVSSYHYTRI